MSNSNETHSDRVFEKWKGYRSPTINEAILVGALAGALRERDEAIRQRDNHKEARVEFESMLHDAITERDEARAKPEIAVEALKDIILYDEKEERAEEALKKIRGET